MEVGCVPANFLHRPNVLTAELGLLSLGPNATIPFFLMSFLLLLLLAVLTGSSMAKWHNVSLVLPSKILNSS